MAKRTYQFGILAEKVALVFLLLKGYRILSWRYKTRSGEIDIIAKRGKVIVMVEVKARKSIRTLEELLHPQQVLRIKKAAEVFLMKNPSYQQCAVRFDFMLISQFLRVRHFKNHF